MGKRRKSQKHSTMKSLQENYDSVKDRGQRDQGRIENINVYEQHYRDPK